MWTVLGFVDDDPSEANRLLVERLGSRVLAARQVAALPAGTAFVVGVAGGAARERLADRAQVRGWLPATLVHPSAAVGECVELGEGALLWAGVTIAGLARLGRHVQVHRGATVGHDAVLGDHVTLLPSSVVSGSVDIGPGATLGTHSPILQGLRIGAGALVGAGACVVRDVPPGATVKGIPARAT